MSGFCRIIYITMTKHTTYRFLYAHLSNDLRSEIWPTTNVYY